MRRLLAGLAMIALTACGASASTTPAPPVAGPRAPVAEGGMCGGFAGFHCQAGLTCRMDAGACHKIADASGVCRKAPRICPMIYQPVCGCDGRTYGNSCQAASKGVSIASTGACKGG